LLCEDITTSKRGMMIGKCNIGLREKKIKIKIKNTIEVQK
jgi:hypothetical protein